MFDFDEIETTNDEENIEGLDGEEGKESKKKEGDTDDWSLEEDLEDEESM